MNTTATEKIPAAKTLNEVRDRVNAIEAQHQAQLAELARQRDIIADRERPLLPLLHRHELERQTIARVEGFRAKYQQQIPEFHAQVDESLRHEMRGSNLHETFTQYPHLLHAERSAAECDRWLAAAKAGLATIEGEIAAVAKERSLHYLLPSHLAHLGK